MAENKETPICSGGDSIQQPNHDGNCPLTEEKNRLANKIISVLDDSENVWKTVSEKQTTLHSLLAQQIVVNDLFSEYNITWRNRDQSVSENIETFHVFTEIDQQVQQLLRLLEEFEVKIERSGTIIKNFIRDMKAHIASLKTSLETVVTAKSLEELADLSIPNMDWIQTIPNPEIDVLAEEWDQLDLARGITHFLQQLRQLVHSGQQQLDPMHEVNH